MNFKTILLLLLPTVFYAQVYEVSYQTVLKTSDSEIGINEIYNSKLYFSPSKEESYYFNQYIDTTFIDNNGGSITQNGYKEFYAVRKRRDSSFSISKHSDLNEMKIVYDDLNFEYELVDEVGPQILGFKTSKAILKWRGRNYIIFYAPDIPVDEGPYKFFGLPGLILSIQDDLNEVSIIAKGFQKLTELPKKCDSIKFKKHDLNYKNFEKFFIQNYWSKKRYVESIESGITASFVYRFIEIIDINNGG